MSIWFVLALGGALGAMARYALSCVWVPVPGHWPYATFIANVLGCWLLGVFFALLIHKAWSPDVKLFVQTGFLGALTTFSTFSLETFQLLIQGHILLAITYCIATCLACILAVWVGHLFVQLFI